MFVISDALPNPAATAGQDRESGETAEQGSIRDLYAGRLLPNIQVNTLRSTEDSFATRTIRRGGPVAPLKVAAEQLTNFPVPANGTEYDLYDYLSRNRVAGLLIMHEDEVVLEHYDLGIDAETRWASMSMAKSVATTLVGAAIKDGFIGSVDEPLTRYLPELVGSCYEGVTIRHLMLMASSVRWNDTHTDPTSERHHMLELQIGQQAGSILHFAAGLDRAGDPGSIWNYSTGDTHIVGALIRAATGQWLADYLSDRIWSRIGMEADAYWWLEADEGLEVAGSGICATLRDYARFARFCMNDGVIDGQPVLADGWMREATSANLVGDAEVNYGYMWWAVPDAQGSLADGAFSARAIFGQYLYVNPRQKTLIAVLSSRSKPKGSEAIVDNDFFNATVEHLKTRKSRNV